MSAFVFIGAGALLLLAGVGLGFWLGAVGRKREAEKASDLQQELDDYRRNVTDHFSVTAEKFQTIGEEYRKFYEHMASGAATLCYPDRSGERLTFPPVDLIARDRQADETTAGASTDLPPCDFEVVEPGTIAATEPVPEGEPAELPDIEPTDEQLIETESNEDLLAERELVQDEAEAGKTFH